MVAIARIARTIPD